MWNRYLFMTKAQIREYDRLAIEELHMCGLVLMENAGRGAAELALRLTRGPRVAVVAGPGNNGGDGFVIARHLLIRGLEVRTYLAVTRDKLGGDALKNLELLAAMGAPIADCSSAEQIPFLADRLRESDLVVDALLGTGATREVVGHLAEVILAINASSTKVLAVDMPSGLDADTGRARGAAVRATATATFGHLKRGLLLFPGASLAGEIEVVPLGVPPHVSMSAGFEGQVIGRELASSLVPSRPADGHKGTFGHLLAVAGAPGKTGAAALAGRAALRAGAGLVTVATTKDARRSLEAKCLEVMVDHILESPGGELDAAALSRAASLLQGKRALAIGPGFSTEPGATALVLHLLRTTALPAVVDADGLNILAKAGGDGAPFASPLVLTPHPGEMSRLLCMESDEVQADRLGAAKIAARRYGAVVVLKGARSVIAAPDGSVFLCTAGNPGMASGGMGDALTGIIGALLAQGLSPQDAAVLGVFAHGVAADRLAQDLGRAGLLASDVIDELPRVFAELRETELKTS